MKNYEIKYGVVKEDNTEWDTYTVTFTYNGVTNFTDSANEDIYDKYALCLKIYTDAYQVDGTWKFPFYGIDDIKITMLEDNCRDEPLIFEKTIKAIHKKYSTS